MNLISNDYLMHHGIKGMKWGVRKRQEANRTFRRDTISARKKQMKTFGSSDYFNRNKRQQANKTFRSDVNRARSKQINSYKESFKMSSETKNKLKAAAIIGGAVAASALVTYGGYKLDDYFIKQRSIATQKMLIAQREQINKSAKYAGYTWRTI